MKLRLLITPDCNRNCKMCCNKNFDLLQLPPISLTEYKLYDEISLTGGEPMLYPWSVLDTLMNIREYSGYQGKINLYTAMPDAPELKNVLKLIDGLTVSVHDPKALADLAEFNDSLVLGDVRGKTLRCKLAPQVHQYAKVASYRFPAWDVETFNWIVDCPLPEGEEFKRL